MVFEVVPLYWNHTICDLQPPEFHQVKSPSSPNVCWTKIPRCTFEILCSEDLRCWPMASTDQSQLSEGLFDFSCVQNCGCSDLDLWPITSKSKQFILESEWTSVSKFEYAFKLFLENHTQKNCLDTHVLNHWTENPEKILALAHTHFPTGSFSEIF